MPGAEKKTRKEKAAVAAKGRAAPGVNKYMPDQSRNAHASIAASSGAQKLLKRAALLQTLLARKESAETRIRLAEIWIELNQSKYHGAARETLETCLKLDPGDAMCARRVLAPLLLSFGEHEAAAALLAQYSNDTSAVMLCCGLLLSLAEHAEAEGEEEEEESQARADSAFERLFACNWQACALLAATARGESPIPEQTVSELREARIAKLASAGGWPEVGGVSEAILLSEVFSGCAGGAGEEEEAEGTSEDAWPGLEGAAVWLSAMTLGKEESEGGKEVGAASSSSSAPKRGRADFEAWREAKRARLAEKLARMPPGGAVSDEEGSDEGE
ncbi:hypothetical protein EMIHUDRAFT_231807 [Emiliania huxleyi CCMP1516]|uniref:Uncharacterized protein n=2 Tax=Emiliania huxleyi TaxID=2903 RepID=A0A0D3K770_EMIH1|nr:hypothetical protein EMIHUDRAFT_231807 [Emiliania huxleyi CCMP1516]EOD31605.1 hypothetical protein EMIHUDRAFT_231807 [Emiliania huxleyi CCMP1516]|eukprot:XP_005784034.1 hypothetical protein EMIHUDRAFT_231807 [Emiliania huxleyi CCMP1516]